MHDCSARSLAFGGHSTSGRPVGMHETTQNRLIGIREIVRRAQYLFRCATKLGRGCAQSDWNASASISDKFSSLVPEQQETSYVDDAARAPPCSKPYLQSTACARNGSALPFAFLSF